MAYDIMFSNAQGFVTGKIYYAQIIGFWSGKFCNGAAMVEAPTFALTVMTVTEPNSWGVFGFGVPALLPADVYKVIFRERATAIAGPGDNIIHEEHINKESIGEKIKFLEMLNVYG